MITTLSMSGLLGMMVLGVAPTAYADNSNDMAAAMQQLAKTSDPVDVKNAQIDLEYDAAQCAAYYNLQSALAQKSGYADTAAGKGAAQAAELATQLTFLLSNSIGMSEDAVEAQLQIDMTDLVQQIGKDYVNMPLVVQKVGMPCKDLLEQPMTRMTHWLEVERSKHHQ